MVYIKGSKKPDYSTVNDEKIGFSKTWILDIGYSIKWPSLMWTNYLKRYLLSIKRNLSKIRVLHPTDIWSNLTKRIFLEKNRPFLEKN